jgi:hypothetical protein
MASSSESQAQAWRCNGTMLLHRDGEGRCTRVGCELDALAHELISSCWDVLAECGCSDEVYLASYRSAPATSRAA